MKTTKYGLRHKKTGKILGVSSSSNEGQDFCGDVSFRLSLHSDVMWSVDTLLNAEYVRNFSTEWYNADYTAPTNEFEPEELEVVEIAIETTVACIEAKIPTFDEYLKIKYGTPGARYYDPEHYAYVLSEVKRNGNSDPKYSLYDLMGLNNANQIPKNIAPSVESGPHR